MALELFGWQAGGEGFVRYGTDPWADFVRVLVHGGRGSGKTHAGAMRVLAYLGAHPGARMQIVAPDYTVLRRATLPKLKEVFDAAGLMEGRDYEHNHTEMRLSIHRNDVTIFLASADTPRSLRGPDLAAVWLDEARDISKEVFTTVTPSLRQPGYPHQMWLTTTPAGKAHWLYATFFPREAYLAGYVDVDASDIEFWDSRTVHAATRENPYGGELTHLANIADYGGEDSPLARQELLGEFVVTTSLAFPEFDRARHVVPRAKWPTANPGRVLGGCDFGYNHAATCIVAGIDGEGRVLVLDEYWRRFDDRDHYAREVKRLGETHGTGYLFADSEDPGWIRLLRLPPYNLHVLPATKRRGTLRNISSGLGLMAWLMRTPGKLLIDPRCHHLITELENYRLPEQRDTPTPDRPVHVADDAVDALRYLASGAARMAWLTPGEGMGKIRVHATQAIQQTEPGTFAGRSWGDRHRLGA